MRNFLHRIAEAIRREPAVFARIDRGGHTPEVSRGQQDQELDKGERLDEQHSAKAPS
jgi:hypothetical protein